MTGKRDGELQWIWSIILHKNRSQWNEILDLINKHQSKINMELSKKKNRKIG